MATNDNKKGINPLAAAVVGAAMGAAAVALSKKENRDKIKAKAEDLMHKGEEKFGKAQKKIEEAKKEGQDKLAESLNKASNKVRSPRTKI